MVHACKLMLNSPPLPFQVLVGHTSGLEVGQGLPRGLRSRQVVDDLLHSVCGRVCRGLHEHLHLRAGRRRLQSACT